LTGSGRIVIKAWNVASIELMFVLAGRFQPIRSTQKEAEMIEEIVVEEQENEFALFGPANNNIAPVIEYGWDED